MISTCKDCEDRRVGCHSTCEKYNQAKAEWEAIKAQKRKDSCYIPKKRYKKKLPYKRSVRL